MSDFHTMQLKDGRIITPLSDYDVLNEIYDYMGQDVHDYVADAILDINVEENIARQKFNSDFHNLEQSNESWHNFVEETAERIEKIRRDIEDNKLTKAKISIELFKIYNDMRGEL